MLSVLKDIDQPAYDGLANKFRQYAACVGIVDTSYFRRRRASLADADDVIQRGGNRLLGDQLRRQMYVGSRDGDLVEDLADDEIFSFFS